MQSELKKTIKEKYNFSERACSGLAFSLIAVALNQKLIDNQEVVVKKSREGIIIKETQSFQEKIPMIMELVNQIPMKDETTFSEFLKVKTDWSLKENREPYSQRELIDHYFGGIIM